MIGQTTTLHVYHAFLYLSLPSLHDYNVKIISRFVEDVNARERLSFSFPELSSKERLKFPYDNRAGEWSLSQLKIYIYISRPRPLHFLEATSLFLLFVISNVCTNKNQQARGLLPVLQCMARRGIQAKEQNHEFRQAKS